MPRNIFWTDADAQLTRVNIRLDDGPIESLLFDEDQGVNEDSRAFGFGFIGPRDILDYLAVNLRTNATYDIVANTDYRGVEVSIYDSQGYLLQFFDPGDSGFFEPLDSDFIRNFRPDYNGLHYIAVSQNVPLETSYGVAVYADHDFNLAPVAADDFFTINQGTVLRGNYARNDFDPDSDFFIGTTFNNPSNGIVEITNDGSFTYSPNPEFVGNDSFVYRIRDAAGAESAATVFVDVSPSPLLGLGISEDEARELALLYEAGLDRNGNIDTGGLNYWIDVREDGAPLRAIARSFLNSNEFTRAFGDVDTLSDLDFVQQLYRNVLDREGEDRGVTFWTGELGVPQITRADVLISFARSAENGANSPFVEDLAEVAPGEWDFLA